MRASNERSVALKNINFDIGEGQVIGIAGIAGNGQNELFAALSGEHLAPRGDNLLFFGQPAGRMNVSQRRRKGLGSLPENRLGHAAVGGFTLWENVLLTHLAKGEFVRRGVIQTRDVLLKTSGILSRFRVKAAGPLALAASLSGGNLQKLIIGREVMQQPLMLVASQPTAGVDANSAADIRRELVDLAENGASVIVISQDLDELLEISDRIAVLSGGELREIKSRQDWTADVIGRAMAGEMGQGGQGGERRIA